MSVTTSQRLNQDTFGSLIPAGTTYGWTGASLESSEAKTITLKGGDDQQLSAAINSAAAQFVDRDANAASLRAKAQQALTVNATFLVLPSPTNAQTLAQVQALTKENSAIIRLLLGQFDSTAGT